MSTAVTNNFAHTTPRASKSDDVYSYNKSSTRMVRALSRVRWKMSWSPRPLRSSLGGRFLGGSGAAGAAGLLLHHFIVMPIRGVVRYLRVCVRDGLGIWIL